MPTSEKRTLRLRAFAKINLCLSVLGKRPDDYHELRTIFQTISLHDTLELAFIANSGVFLEVSDSALPSGPENLVWRAIAKMRDELQYRIELCPCSSVSGPTVELEVREEGGRL